MMVAHYIGDLVVFGHVMGSTTDWGSETHHSDYETYVNTRTNSYDDEFSAFLVFDGTLESVSAYDVALKLANDTTFDFDGALTCVWMDQYYNWNDPAFKNRCGESLNLAVNLLADVLHAFYIEVIPEFPPSAILPLFMILTVLIAIYLKKRDTPMLGM